MSGDGIVDEREEITQFGSASEYLMLGLRTSTGISEQEYHDLFPCSFEPIEHYLEKCAQHGWAECNEGRWSFTPSGFLISNILIGDILELQQGQWSSRGKYYGQTSLDIQQQLSMFPREKHDISVFKGG
jgi:oxygen-independent coproporphyrinogen-3 oxidase